MANRKASIWLYVKTPAGWRYCRPMIGKNNKPKPGWAHVNSDEEHHPDASYYVRHRESSKTVWTKCETLSTAIRLCELQKSDEKVEKLRTSIREEENYRREIKMTWAKFAGIVAGIAFGLVGVLTGLAAVLKK